MGQGSYGIWKCCWLYLLTMHPPSHIGINTHFLHLSSENISAPTVYEGWGICQFHIFNNDLNKSIRLTSFKDDCMLKHRYRCGGGRLLYDSITFTYNFFNGFCTSKYTFQFRCQNIICRNNCFHIHFFFFF